MMNPITPLFIELVQVALGAKVCLSHTPSTEEWEALYGQAKKQSLVGVCFAGVQKLVEQQQTPEEMLYLTWMGMAAKIQQKNEVVNRQCVDLQKRLSADGLRSAILKGQGMAQLYGSIAGLRQSGDIDVWAFLDVADDLGTNRKRLIEYMQKVSPTKEVSLLHTHLRFFDDTEVELHFSPTYLRCPWYDKKLQRWFVEEGRKGFHQLDAGFIVPSDEFNAIFILAHIYKHLIVEGIGLRQVLDYYFVLKNSHFEEEQKSHICQLLKSFGMMKFARAVMWILQTEFCLETEYLLCESDNGNGEKLLKEIMQSGNFGHNDERRKLNKNAINRFFEPMWLTLSFMPDYPWEYLFSPIYRIKERIWMWRNGHE